MQEDAIRVFFHELGHFLAHEINHRRFKGTGVRSISITPYPGSAHLYEGDTKINVSPDGKENMIPEIDALPEFLAAVTYGCIFQSYYQNKDRLNDCTNLHGGIDYAQWWTSLCRHAFDLDKPEFIKVESDYYTSLRKDKALAVMMELDPNKYMKDIGGNIYEVDVDLLRQDTSPFIDAHLERYKNLLEGYTKIIERQ